MRHPMSTTTTPPWLIRMLTEQGHISDTGLTRNATIRTHKPCHHPTLAGIDDIGFDTWCDLAELHPQGEANALLDGRWTFDLYASRLLCHRTPNRITHAPAGQHHTRDYRPVFAEHRCHQPIPATWAIPPTPAPTSPPPSQEETSCPF